MAKAKRNIVPFDNLDPLYQRLLMRAKRAMRFAYNPISKFDVGSAVVSLDGKRIFSGCNVENAAFSPTICAECTAIVKACSVGVRMFKAIAVIARGKFFDCKEPTAPCGRCRQFIYEFRSLARVNTVVIIASTHMDVIEVTTIDHLLPRGFGPEEIELDVESYRKGGTALSA